MKSARIFAACLVVGLVAARASTVASAFSSYPVSDPSLPAAYVEDGDAVARKVVAASAGVPGTWLTRATAETRQGGTSRSYTLVATTSVATTSAESRFQLSAEASAGAVSLSLAGRTAAAGAGSSKGYLYLDSAAAALGDFLASAAAAKLKLPAKPILVDGLGGAVELAAEVSGEPGNGWLSRLFGYGAGSLELIDALRAAKVPASLSAANGEFTVIFAVPTNARGDLAPLGGGIVGLTATAKTFKATSVWIAVRDQRLADEVLGSLQLRSTYQATPVAPAFRKVSRPVAASRFQAEIAKFAGLLAPSRR